MKLQQSIGYLRKLVFPDICICCWEKAPVQNGNFCIMCLSELPFTDHFEFDENRVTKKFWGIAQVENGASLLYFDKGSLVREMIHKMKYNNKPSIANALGRRAGEKMLATTVFNDIDVIIPVPLHKKRRAQRGYNQSEVFARGISEVTSIPVAVDVLLKTYHTTTQTDKSRYERFENVRDSFLLENIEKIKGRHILLVDDVITTGATMDACLHILEAVSNVQCSVMTIVMAKN